jgi:hypothetical protein
VNSQVPLLSLSRSQYQRETLIFHDKRHFAKLQAEFICEGRLLKLINPHPRILLAALEEDLLRGMP